MKKVNFTLIELLVVIAILGILSSILLPSLHKSRAASQAAVCMSNLQQLGRFSMVFAQEHNNILPHSCSNDSGVAPSSRYFTDKYYDKAGKYTHFFTIWRNYGYADEGLNCPTARQELQPRWEGEGNKFNDYSQNFYMGGMRNGGVPRTTRLKSTNYIFTDGNLYSLINGSEYHIQSSIRLKQNGSGNLPWMNDDIDYPELQGHSRQTSNFLFGDLHIETRNYNKLISLNRDDVDELNGKND
ncbi:MAG: type II secretion system GspH family protein [Lentisphaeraceae bacterium]|nr:type II secretion system GspH family protein [Lentisphaeraceae bacterium]